MVFESVPRFVQLSSTPVEIWLLGREVRALEERLGRGRAHAGNATMTAIGIGDGGLLHGVHELVGEDSPIALGPHRAAQEDARPARQAQRPGIVELALRGRVEVQPHRGQVRAQHPLRAATEEVGKPVARVEAVGSPRSWRPRDLRPGLRSAVDDRVDPRVGLRFERRRSRARDQRRAGRRRLELPRCTAFAGNEPVEQARHLQPARTIGSRRRGSPLTSSRCRFGMRPQVACGRRRWPPWHDRFQEPRG